MPAHENPLADTGTGCTEAGCTEAGKDVVLACLINETEPHDRRWLRPIRFSKASVAREFLRVKKRVLRHSDERRFRIMRRADAPIGFLVNVEPYHAFDSRKTGAQSGNDLVDPLAFVSASFGRR